MSAPFGQPGSIRPDVVATLPPAMQAEAVLLLIDMGQAPAAIFRQTGLEPAAIDRLLALRPQHRRRDGWEDDRRWDQEHA